MSILKLVSLKWFNWIWIKSLQYLILKAFHAYSVIRGILGGGVLLNKLLISSLHWWLAWIQTNKGVFSSESWNFNLGSFDLWLKYSNFRTRHPSFPWSFFIQCFSYILDILEIFLLREWNVIRVTNSLMNTG